MKKNIRLTQKRAKEIVKRELGISCTGLTTEVAAQGVFIYKMQLGRFEVTVENDWYEQNGLLKIQISSHTGGSIDIFYNPNTLEENYEAAAKQRDEIRKERCTICELAIAARKAGMAHD